MSIPLKKNAETVDYVNLDGYFYDLDQDQVYNKRFTDTIRLYHYSVTPSEIFRLHRCPY